MFMSLKKVIKSFLEGVLYLVGPKFFHRLNESNLLILTYHRVLPANHPDLKFEQPGMYVTPETFQLHMNEVKRRFTVVHLNDWVKKLESNEKLPKYACAITFDDGWKDNYEYAYPILKELGIPATIFLVSDYISTTYNFWPNRLSRFLGSIDNVLLRKVVNSEEGQWLKRRLSSNFDSTPEEKDNEYINRIIEICKVYNDDEINSFLDRLQSKYPDYMAAEATDLLDEKQVTEMVGSGLIRVGSHTCQHKRLLDSLNDEEITHEVSSSKKELMTRFNSPVEIFCYPNGDFNDFSIDLVQKNYIAACSTYKGWNNVLSDKYLLKRIGVHEDISNTKRKFAARLSGLI
jgi:peptidoglycan/xylan/chitin deacetylase (PgdA/CDA1 family)